MAELRGRRLLEMQNDRLLGELLEVRGEATRLRMEAAEARLREAMVRAEMELREVNWQNSRRNRYATTVAQLMRGPVHERLHAASSLARMVGGAAVRRVKPPRPAAVHQVTPSAPTLEYPPPSTDPWAEWRAICADRASSDAVRQIQPHGGDGPLRIALIYSGGMGDVLQTGLIAAALKQDLAPCAITLLHNNKSAPAIQGGNNSIETVAVIPSDYKHVRAVLARLPIFDLIVDFQYCIRYIVPPESRVPGSLVEEKVLSAATMGRPWLKFMDDFPWRNNQLGRAAGRAGLTLMDIAGLSGALDVTRASPIPFFPDMDSYDVVLGLVPNPYITIHNGVDEKAADFYDVEAAKQDGYTATKLLPMPTWIEVVRQLKDAGFAIAQIGLKKEELIPGVTHDLRGLTSISEVGLIIKNGECHIDTEGGLVHLARAVNRRSVVIFGPTPTAVFGYDQNVNISSSSCNDCWWITNDWLGKCPRGTIGPECMAEHTPATIVGAVNAVTSRAYVASTELLGAQLFTIAGMQALEPLRTAIYAACDLPYNGLSSHVQQQSTGIYVHASKNWEYPLVLNAIRDMGLHLKPGLRVADVGGGRGALSFALGRVGAEAEVFDIDYRWDSQGDPAIEDRFIRAFRKVGHARFGSIFNIPADDETYDVVTCVSVVEHIYYKRQAIAELLRILKPGGLLALTFDLVEDLTAAGLTDHLRKEIFDLPALAQELQAFGVDVMPFDTVGVRRSILEIQEAGVLGIPPGMTVGGVILRKVRMASPIEG
ncbi:MAG TPA: methyltransferase domain-containing protein [Acetobacteraceae bacterium]|nr:methyltransferase domain-containing protein [Acetobacteraceae bacterium]